MRTLKQIAALLCLSLPVTAGAQAPEKLPLDPGIKTGQLPNGLKYYIIQNRKPEQKIELRMVVNAGSILEDQDQLGLAHLMEHMNFNGLAHFPKNEVVHYLQSIGVDFGADLNAYTSFDETVYILPIPADDKKKIDQGFQVIADWSHAALLEHEEIDKERGVVLEESRLGKGADDRMMKQWLPEYLNGSLYGRRLPIGDDNILKNAKYEVLKRYHKDWYRPDLEAVMVVGDIDPNEAERIIKDKFGGFKNPDNPRPRPAFFEVPARKASKAMVLSDPEAPYTTIQIIGNARHAKNPTTVSGYVEDLRRNLFNMMLGERFEELKNVANPPFIAGYGGYSGGWARDWESYQLYAICGTDKIKPATEALVGTSLRVKKFGFTQAELERAKAAMLANYERLYNERDKTESRTKVDELVRHFLTNEPVPGIAYEYELVRKVLPGISVDQVNKIKDAIDIDKTYFALVTTKTAAQLPTDAQLKGYVDNSLKAPLVAVTEKALPVRLLAAEPVPGEIIKEERDEKAGTTTWTLSNGARVTFKRTDFKNDEILFSGYRFGGSSCYTGADYQSADYCNNVVDDMGYGQFSSTDLNKFLKGKTVSVNTWVDLNSDDINGRSSVKDFETAMQLMYLKCTQPRADEAAFASFKSRQRQLLAQMKSDPQSYFSDTLSKFLYRNNQRMKDIPDPADYDAIQLSNALSFYNRRFNTANGMNYFFVGSLPEATFKGLVEKYIGGLGGEPVETQSRDLGIEPVAGEHNFTIHVGSEPKSMVNEMSYFYTPYDQEDELELNLLAEVVNNRITDIIREKMSAIYGGGVGLSLRKFPKEKFSMQSYLPCGPENAEKVKAAFWEIIRDCKTAGNISQEELGKATETAIQKYRVGVKTNGYWLSTLARYQQLGAPTGNINNYEARVKAVTPAMLTKTANKYLGNQNVLHALMMPAKG